MSKVITPWKVWARVALDVINSLAEIPAWLALSHDIDNRHTLDDDFIGVNIATSDDPECDEQVLGYLADLNIHHVRMDYSYCAVNGNAQRLLDRVLADGFTVLLNVFPDIEQAALLADDEEAQRRWHDFLQQLFSRYGDKVAAFEIGSTPNRGKWSGFEAISYLQAWRIAAQLAENFELTLAGPNISDFEPLYNFAYLRAMQRIHSVPSIHTDNLFVERVVQPEAYDHRVLGRWATRKLNLNLVKKARIIAAIGRRQGCQKTYCTYSCWTRKRLSRWTAKPEQKNADYLFRYLIIAAASGALNRVYWGPLICNRDGLVDCGDNNYPDIDNVSFYKEVRGKVADFQPTKGYQAFKHIAKLLRQVTCLQAVMADNGINHFVFSNKQGGEIHIAWCLDQYSMPLSKLYSAAALSTASFKTVYGQQPLYQPAMMTEQPLIIEWPIAQSARPSSDYIRRLDNLASQGVIYNVVAGLQAVAVDTPQWRGVVAVADEIDVDRCISAYMPQALLAAEELSVLRDARNRLWNVCLNTVEGEIQTVKLNRARGIKKFTYRFMPSKGKRHWNNATEMLRRGINTPQPLAFFERHSDSGIEDNYYVCRFIANAFSARDVLTAFKKGEQCFKGINKVELYQQMASFIAHMHNRGIIHRDLSAGNLMMTLNDGELRCYAIDIGRAVIDVAKRLTAGHRYLDLKRICYNMSWADRRLFIAAYNHNLTKPLPSTWRLSVFSYVAKQTLKKIIKGKYRWRK